MPLSYTKMLLPALLGIISLLASVASVAQSSTFYVCAGYGFKLTVPVGYDEYEWASEGVIISGADSNELPVAAVSAEEIGNTSIVKNYTLKVRNTEGCWSDEGSYSVNILPQLSVTTDGFMPPYCEHTPQDINLIALINGAPGTSALSLPAGVGVAYEWSVISGAFPDGNAAIGSGTATAIATVKTPASSEVANDYKVRIYYTYPSGVDIAADVIGNCSDEHVEHVYADPVPEIPTINVTHL